MTHAEEERLIAQANSPVMRTASSPTTNPVPDAGGQYVTVPPKESTDRRLPEQIWSVATAMIPFLEHDDANARDGLK